MVTVIIEQDPFLKSTDLMGAIPQLEEVKCKGEVPAHFFERLVETDAEWYLDLTHANDEEAANWAFEDIFARCKKAFREGKTVVLVGVTINEGDLYDELWRFVQECKEIPDVQSFSETLITVGSPCVYAEQFWPELMD